MSECVVVPCPVEVTQVSSYLELKITQQLHTPIKKKGGKKKKAWLPGPFLVGEMTRNI